VPHPWPAIDVQPSAPAPDPEELQGVVLAALDDCSVTAVLELPSGWRFFFNNPGARDRAVRIVGERWPNALSATAVDVPDEDWARRSQDNLGAIRVGRVTIAPPCAPEAGASPPPGLAVIIQPSMGFGTGHHATTRLCTALLQQLDLAGRTVLDIGTGSGVLALVASRLGADAVLGVDDDPDALESARENLQLNDVTGGIELREADFRTLPAQPVDGVTANLTGALLVRGAAHVLSTLAPGGSLILSGITLEEELDVRARFDPELRLASRLEEDGWVGLRYESTTI